MRSALDKRLFLALWPNAEQRQQIAQIAAQALGKRRRVADANLHLTLVFLGATDAHRCTAYCTALADLSVPEMCLNLDHYGYWKRPGILWLGAQRTPPELYELVAALQRRLRGCGFVPEARAFQAHVTLARHFTGILPSEPPKPVLWPVRDMVLVESRVGASGVEYQVLKRWPQHGTAPHVLL